MGSAVGSQLVRGNEICVVVPVHRSTLQDYERVSLLQLKSILHSYDRFLAIPKGLNVQEHLELDDKLRVVEFPSRYFESKRGYSILCRSPLFYKAFLDFKYLLIYQLDCFVFEDALTVWANKGFDYIGSPWVDETWIKAKTRRWPIPFRLRPLSLVGNGGFSLRNVQKSYSVSHVLRLVPTSLISHEDVLWSNFASIIRPDFNVADFSSALSFAFETNPAEAFRLNHRRLPFGCHAWERIDPDFWKEKISGFGYTIT